MSINPLNRRKVWGIVLAGGEGTRVQPFLAALCGGKGIKQFCAVIGRRSMLHHTLARVERIIPRERILVIVGANHRDEAIGQLANWPEQNIVYQPANRETAAGILLPLAHVSHRDPDAAVAVFPSDHFVLDEPGFMKHAEMAVSETDRYPRELVLLGMTPDRLEEGYGWIEPGAGGRSRESRPVSAFREKPPLEQARSLFSNGALWNTLVFACRGETLWSMVHDTAPDLCRKFWDIRLMLGSIHAPMFIEYAYKTMRSVNFSSDVCGRLNSRLRVLAVPDVGWSDWGSAERIFASLKKLGRLEECVRRLNRRRYTDPAVRRLLDRALPKPQPASPQAGGLAMRRSQNHPPLISKL